MKKDWVKVAQTSRFLRKAGNYADFQVEFVTDQLVQLVVTFNATDRRVDQGAWLLALAVDHLGLEIEAVTGNPFMSFSLVFDAARSMINARSPKKRRELAEYGRLPVSLGVSEDTPRE